MDINLLKKNLAEYVVINYVKSNMTLGLGTGSTCEFAIKKIAELISNGHLSNVRIVPTSSQTKYILDEQGIVYYSLNSSIINQGIDLSIDGADEIVSIADRKFIIKGGGGALLGEKTVEMYSKKFIVFADSSKLVKQLGSFAVPVEVLPYVYNPVKRELEKRYGCVATLRMAVRKAGAIVTDSGNYILDCKFNKIEDPEKLERDINSITGVIENGIFSYKDMEIIVGYDESTFRKI